MALEIFILLIKFILLLSFTILYYSFLVLLWAIFIALVYSLFCDAPCLPSSKKVLNLVLELADIQPDETVYDLGCGDGRFVFAAHDKGANAVGFEINWLAYYYARIRQKILKKGGTIKRCNYHHQDLGDADVIYCYLCPWGMKTLEKKIKKECKKGCRIISHCFELKDLPSKKYEVDGKINPMRVLFKYVIE